MRYRVVGAHAQTGQEINEVIDVPDQASAEKWAAFNGILVESVGADRPAKSKLVPCPECGKMLSRAAPACPDCGHPMHAAAPAPAPSPQVIHVVASAQPQAKVVGNPGCVTRLITAFGGLLCIMGAVPLLLKAFDSSPTAGKTDDRVAVGMFCLLVGLIFFALGRGMAKLS